MVPDKADWDRETKMMHNLDNEIEQCVDNFVEDIFTADPPDVGELRFTIQRLSDKLAESYKREQRLTALVPRAFEQGFEVGRRNPDLEADDCTEVWDNSKVKEDFMQVPKVVTENHE